MDNIYKQLKNNKIAKFLKNNLIGIERESLRTNPNGTLTTTTHPKKLGATLTHPYITTDFAESLIEIITPPLKTADKVLEFLENNLHFVYHNLENNEKLWASSMPCIIRGKSEINIAKYGPSNQGQMKEIYRKGLANRYGKAMQVVAGVHFNYSFSDDFWLEYQNIIGCNKPLQELKNEKYMHIIRNVLRYGWILYYYFGASNSVCKGFLHNYNQHNLIPFDETTLYCPYATSLRMSDIGYQNSKEDESGIKANYNSIKQYAHSLQDAMSTSFDEYEKIGIKVNGKYQQLNTNILQIENEYYSSVRPKPIPESGIMPSISLMSNGIEYIELRGFDLNPLNPLGVSKQQILFAESFLLFCLLEESKPISSKELVAIDNNNLLVAEKGRDKNIELNCKNQKIKLPKLIDKITNKITKVAELFGDDHKNAIINISPLNILEDMENKNLGFSTWANELANNHKEYFNNKPINQEFFNEFNILSKKSLKDTQILEQNSIHFDDFLTNYFKQL